MKHTVPHRITHISLDRNDGEFSIPGNEAHYCSFWWKQIPLGHLFIPSGRYREPGAVRQAAIRSLAPTIDFYASRQGINPGDYQSAFLAADKLAFAAAMETVLGELLYSPRKETVDISVIICTRNRADKLRRCLEQLLRQVSPPAEIIVVDNAPADSRTAQVVAEFPAVRYYLEPRAGLDIARNAGARTASYPVIAYVDDDVQVHADWAYRVWEVFQNPAVDAMTGLIIASELATESQLIFERYWSFNRGYCDKQYDASFIRQGRKGGAPVWDIGAGANMAFRKSALEKAGYFDERLDVGAAGCSGDSEMWFRILSHGMQIHYTPRAVVYHEHRADLKALRRQIFYYMRGFAAAALIQHRQDRQAGYDKHFYNVLLPYYLKLLKEGIPRFRGRHRTVVSEIFGVLSGTLFFLRNRNKPAQPPSVSL